jgi:hypothetical protein
MGGSWSRLWIKISASRGEERRGNRTSRGKVFRACQYKNGRACHIKAYSPELREEFRVDGFVYSARSIIYFSRLQNSMVPKGGQSQ